MSKHFISGTDFIQMMLRASEHLTAHAKDVNALNVFPVPDGDTGTNMNMTLTSGVEELKRKRSSHLGKAAEALAKGLLMGARGNSGVILSQLFRGFAKAVSDLEEMNAAQFAAALQQGVDTAYKAVAKPVEGTILSVAREAAKHAGTAALRTTDMADFMREVTARSKEALARTPEQLPVLKQVGVVDAGGQGLVYIYEGFALALGGDLPAAAPESPAASVPAVDRAPAANRAVRAERQPDSAMPGHAPAQVHLATEDIEFGYCTEFMIRLSPEKTQAQTFSEIEFRKKLEAFGDSILVVADDDLVKVHLHAEDPGGVLSLALTYGDLDRIKIENMRIQHSHILEETRQAPSALSDERAGGTRGGTKNAPEPARGAQAGDLPRGADPASAGEGERAGAADVPPSPADAVSGEADAAADKPLKPYAIVVVSAGSGLDDIFRSIGADVVIAGGQTMNPSTEDIVRAVMRAPAEIVFVLPNNSNIVLAAQQAKDLAADRRVEIVPTKTIPQGMAAVLAFNPAVSAEENLRAMEAAVQGVRSGQVTVAVRDTRFDGLDIREGQYIGLMDNRLTSASDDLIDCCMRLIGQMLEGGRELLTVLTGADAREEDTERLLSRVSEAYPEVETDVRYGGQPIYAYLFAAE